MTIQAFVILADGFEEIEAVTPIDVLRRAGMNVTTVGLLGKTVTGSHDIVFQADQTWSDVSDQTPDLLVLPGGMPGSKHLGEHDGLSAMAHRVSRKNGYLAAICAASAFTLGPWGLLAGRRATCYPGFESQFPGDVDYREDGVVADGRIITGRGPGVALPFALAVVETITGADSAAGLKAVMQFPG